MSGKNTSVLQRTKPKQENVQFPSLTHSPSLVLQNTFSHIDHIYSFLSRVTDGDQAQSTEMHKSDCIPWKTTADRRVFITDDPERRGEKKN